MNPEDARNGQRPAALGFAGLNDFCQLMDPHPTTPSSGDAAQPLPDRLPASTAGHPPASRYPRWLRLLLGRQILRACPAAPKIAACTGCRLRALCKCAHDEILEAVAVENRCWAILAVCGAAVLLYVLVSFLHSR
jgi:hypothetical protein